MLFAIVLFAPSCSLPLSLSITFPLSFSHPLFPPSPSCSFFLWGRVWRKRAVCLIAWGHIPPSVASLLLMRPTIKIQHANICPVVCLSLNIHSTLTWDSAWSHRGQDKVSFHPPDLPFSGIQGHLVTWANHAPLCGCLLGPFLAGEVAVINMWFRTTAETKTWLCLCTACYRHKCGFLISWLFVMNDLFCFFHTSNNNQTSQLSIWAKKKKKNKETFHFFFFFSWRMFFSYLFPLLSSWQGETLARCSNFIRCVVACKTVWGGLGEQMDHFKDLQDIQRASFFHST